METIPNAQTALIDRASYVHDRAVRYEDLRRLATQQRDFESQLEKLRTPTQTLEGLNVVRRQLAAEGVPLQPLVFTSALREELTTFTEDFRKDRSVLIDPRHAPHRKALIKRLDALVEDRNSKTTADWHAYVLDLIPSIREDVLDVLGRVVDFRNTVTIIRNELRALKASAEQLPSSEDAIKAVRQGAERMSSAWTTLGGEGLPEEVLTFLREAGDKAQGAPLQRLTSTVREWLSRHNLEDGFVIRMRNTAPSGGRR